MKKILSLLTVLTLTASGASSVVSCGTKKTVPDPNQKKADDIALKLKDKTIRFKQSGKKTKASDYKKEIQAALNTEVHQTPTAYSFDFDGKSGDTPLSTVGTNISIKIKVSTVVTSAFNIKMKFSSVSDQQKANDIAAKLDNLEITLRPDSTKSGQTADDYKSEIQAKLDAKQPQTDQNYSFKFATTPDSQKALSTKPEQITINIDVNGALSGPVNIKVKLNAQTDQDKVDDIVNTLKTATLAPIKLDINTDNKQTLPDYFKSDIKAKLDAKLTNQEKTYNYSIVNTDKITNTAKDFDVKIKINDATSKESFKLNVAFNYKSIEWSLPGATENVGINQIKVFNKIKYAATTQGLYHSTASDGKNFARVVGIPSDANVIKVYYTDTASIKGTYAITSGFLYKSSDGSNFQKVTIPITNKNLTSIAEVDSKIILGTNKGLYVSSDGTNFTALNSNIKDNYILSIANDTTNNKTWVGTSAGLWYKPTGPGQTFTQVSNGIPTNSTIKSIKISNSKIYVGTTLNGLWVSSDGASFTKLTSIKDDAVINVIQQIGSNIYVGTNSGLYISSDGTSFTKINLDATFNTIMTIAHINNQIQIGALNNKKIYYNFVS